MRSSRIVLMLLILTLLGTRASHAQEAGSVGLTMGYPASVGMIWHMTKGFALRPEVSWSKHSIDSSTLVQGQWSTDYWQVSTGLSALFYVHHWDALHAYVSPRFSYLKTRTTTMTDSWSRSGYVLAGSFGAQYSTAEHFGVFGEAGLGYSTTTTSTDGRFWSEDALSAGTLSGVGVVFYF